MQTRPDNETNFIGHTSCDACGSSDGNGVYDDGGGKTHTYCFSCSTYQSDSERDGEKPTTISNQAGEKSQSLLKGEAKALAARGLTEADCAKFGYWVGLNHKGEQVQIADLTRVALARHFNPPC